MQNRYYATFGSGQLEDYDVIGGPNSVLLQAPAGFTENEFRAVLQVRFDNKYCTTYSDEVALELLNKYGLRIYTMAQLQERRL